MKLLTSSRHENKLVSGEHACLFIRCADRVHNNDMNIIKLKGTHLSFDLSMGL